MGLINQAGYYKGVIVSGEFGNTAKGLPQSVWILKASEVYDEENKEYLPADSEADEITAYLVMFNHDKSENFNNPQIKKITGWDGADFNVLADMDVTNIELSWQVGYGKGDYADRLGVDRVNLPDASPTRTVAKLDKAQVNALQAKYAGALATTKAPTKPVSAKKGKKTVAKAPVKGKRPTAPKTTTIKPETTAPVGKCSADDAYNECYSLKRDDVTEERLNELWTKFAAQVNKDEAAITEEQWFEIKTKLLAVTAKV